MIRDMRVSSFILVAFVLLATNLVQQFSLQANAGWLYTVFLFLITLLDPFGLTEFIYIAMFADMRLRKVERRHILPSPPPPPHPNRITRYFRPRVSGGAVAPISPSPAAT